MKGSDVIIFEILKAIDFYKLPGILAITDEDIIKKVTSSHLKKLTKILFQKMKEGKVKALFIPFKLKAIKIAIDNFNIQYNDLKYSNYT